MLMKNAALMHKGVLQRLFPLEAQLLRTYRPEFAFIIFAFSVTYVLIFARYLSPLVLYRAI